MTPNETLFNFLKSKGVISFQGSYSAWRAKDEPKEEPDLEIKGEELQEKETEIKNKAEFEEFKNGLSKKEKKQFQEVFEL